MMKTMTMSHPVKRKSRTMGIIILKMGQPVIVGMIIQVIPYGDHLFTTNENNPEKLSKEETINFHHVTANLLYLAKRAIPDLQLGAALLWARVKGPDKYDWNKLIRFMKYIRSTIGLPLILGIGDTNTLCWYVDASFGVHIDMKSPTGMMMTMGQGAASSNLIKHKFNTKISTDAELFGIDD